MKQFQFFLIVILVVSCNKTNKEDYILPDWERGDYRFIKTNVYSFSRINSDTVYDLAAENLYKFSVIDVSNDQFTIEMQNITKPNFDYGLGTDTIGDGLNKIISLLESFPKISIPYQVRLTKTGKINEIVDWEIVLDKYVSRMIQIADSIGFGPEEHHYIKQYFSSTIGIEEDLRNALFNEISDILELYDIKIPATDSIIAEGIEVPNPSTGSIIEGELKYRTLSITNGMYEIEMRMEFDDDIFVNPDEYVDSFFKKDTTKNKVIPEMEIYSIYYWNSNTSWIDSSKFYMNVFTDTVEVRMMTKALMYK